jgi:hypothetical protein
MLNNRFGNKKDPIDESLFENEEYKYKIRVFDESIKMARNENGQKTKLQTIINTSDKCIPFGPSKKLSELIGTNKESRLRLTLNKEATSSESKSFIFDKKTLEVFIDSKMSPIYYETIMALRYFAKNRLYIISTKPTGIIGLNVALPIHSRNKIIVAPMTQKRISIELYEEVNKMLSNMSIVLTQLVPGLSISLKKISDTITPKGESGYSVIPVAHRGDLEIPLRDESDGVRKIISILSLIIAAYNDSSTTIAIDEFDAGIFEYLLGEILQSFEESGKGQFIFTSHNLRPLEVIDKKYLVFTTTNESNRYYRFKDVSSTNNLRDKYYREIILGEQDEELYSRTKRYKIESAMRKAFEG